MADTPGRQATSHEAVFNEAGDAQQAEPDDQQPEQEKDAQQAERLDDVTEQLLAAAAQNLGEATMFSLVQRIHDGTEIGEAELGRYASQLGVEPHEAAPAIERVKTAFMRQAQRAVGMDEDAYNRFSDWVRANHPDEARMAVIKHYNSADLSGYKSLAERFLATGKQYGEDELLNAEVGPGIETYWQNGEVMVRTKEGTFTARDAIRTGIIRVSKKQARDDA